ncbi:MAG: glycosyltransferase [Legionella sp.]|uniref:glycosyltransferase n=1 Tax=Legionella sp. TaxID=459 RepID=UPI00283AFCEC|nr:glycosyltransferase [Legionella sp.]
MSFEKFEQEPSFETKEAMVRIANSITSQRDSVGIDPWGMRQFKPATTSIEDLKKTICTGKAVVDDNKTIPKRVHFIWLGSYFTNPLYRKVVAEWASNNPDYQIYLWHHAVTKDPMISEEVARWANENNINLMDIEQTLIGSMQTIQTKKGTVRLDDLYANEIIRRQFAGASDVLRLVILHFFGGIYCDIDIRNIRPMGIVNAEFGILLNCGGNDYFIPKSPGKNDFYNPQQFKAEYNVGVNNDIIASVEGHHHLHALMVEMCQRYLTTNDMLFNDRIDAPDHNGFNKKTYHYKQDAQKIPSRVLNTARVIFLGPAVIDKFLRINKIIADYFFSNQVLKKEYVVPYQYFAMFNCFSWGFKEISFPENTPNELLIKWILTIILNDLSHEPRVLYLDAFAETLNQNNLIDSIVTILFSHFPEEVAQLETVHLTNLWMTDFSLNFLLNTKTLKTNYELQDNLGEIDPSPEEIQKFIFLHNRIPIFAMKILKTFLASWAPRNFPRLQEAELEKIVDLMRQYLAPEDVASLLSSAYQDSLGTHVIPFEYAKWLCAIHPLSDMDKYLALRRLYTTISAWALLPLESANLRISELFQKSAYSSPDFQSRLLVPRTMDNYCDYLINEIDNTHFTENSNSQFIARIAERWQITNLRPLNEKLLELLLKKPFLTSLPESGQGLFKTPGVDLMELAIKQEATPLIEYLKSKNQPIQPPT